MALNPANWGIGPPEGDPAGPAGPPEGLKAGGADLWRSVMARWEVDRPHELRLLLEICRMADLLDVLHAQAESDAHDRGMGDGGTAAAADRVRADVLGAADPG